MSTYIIIFLLCLILVAINRKFLWLFLGVFLLFIAGYGQPPAPVTPAPSYWEGVEK